MNPYPEHTPITVLGDLTLIGLSVLRRFTLTLDHDKQVILEP
jgi:hypothetical protein